MSLEKFRQELEEYCDENQFTVEDNRIELKVETFSRLVLLEHLCEAIHPYDLEVSYDSSLTVTEGNPLGGSGEIQGLVQNNEHVIDRAEYEDRYVEDERHKTGGDEVYLIVKDQSKARLVDTLNRCLECGYYPAGYDLQRRSDPNLLILGEAAN